MSEVARFPALVSSGDERQLPRNIEAEAAFLGAILIDNRVVEDLPVQLNSMHFFEPLHGRIFAQTMALIERNRIATPVTLKPYFENDEALKANRKSYVWGKGVSVRVDLGGRRINNKKRATKKT